MFWTNWLRLQSRQYARGNGDKMQRKHSVSTLTIEKQIYLFQAFQIAFEDKKRQETSNREKSWYFEKKTLFFLKNSQILSKSVEVANLLYNENRLILFHKNVVFLPELMVSWRNEKIFKFGKIIKICLGFWKGCLAKSEGGKYAFCGWSSCHFLYRKDFEFH